MKRILMLSGLLSLLATTVQAAQKTDKAEGLVEMCRFAMK